ncbi:MAG TPA: DUF378 domain-containing protein [Fimbriimonadaceae bacterium]|nr:DUF378 domain-containing protein [Fimbriimonadaceae bacterium]
MKTLNAIALLLIIVGAVNWGLVGFFQFDLVAAIFGGQDAMMSRIVYSLVGLAGIYSLSLFAQLKDSRNSSPSGSAARQF